MSFPKVKVDFHIGKKIERIRELKGVKQETLAARIGVTQQTISRIEQTGAIDEEKLQKIAEALDVTVDAIENFNEDAIFHLIQNNSENSSNNYLIGYQHNPVEKIIDLYERMLKDKDEMLKQKDEIIEMYKQQLKAS